MKLFYSPGACSLSPHIVLEETGLPYEAILAPTKTKQLPDGSDFRKVNPLGYVPYLINDAGEGLAEGPAIVQYIADQAPDKKLAPPAGTWARYQLQSMLNFISTEIHKGFGPLFNPAMPDEAKHLARAKLAERLGYLNEKLANQPYLMGQDFTVADAYLFTVTNWAKSTQVDLAPFAHLLAFRERMAARPAVQCAMQAEGLRG